MKSSVCNFKTNSLLIYKSVSIKSKKDRFFVSLQCHSMKRLYPQLLKSWMTRSVKVNQCDIIFFLDFGFVDKFAEKLLQDLNLSSLTVNINSLSSLSDVSIQQTLFNNNNHCILRKVFDWQQAMNTLSEQLTRVCELLKEIKRLEFNYNTLTIPQLVKDVLLFGVEFGSYVSLNKFRYVTVTRTNHNH